MSFIHPLPPSGLLPLPHLNALTPADIEQSVRRKETDVPGQRETVSLWLLDPGKMRHLDTRFFTIS